jgi:hypothetical protein
MLMELEHERRKERDRLQKDEALRARELDEHVRRVKEVKREKVHRERGGGRERERERESARARERERERERETHTDTHARTHTRCLRSLPLFSHTCFLCVAR